MELLIHIGMDTVRLEGEGFAKHVNEGDRITKGTKIVSFDIDKIKKAGYDTTVSVVVSNMEAFSQVEGVPMESADNSRTVIRAIR